MKGYNFAYLDEQTKRMIRRALLKAVAIPGHQVPFGSREMPLPYGWGTGGIQVTAAILGAKRPLIYAGTGVHGACASYRTNYLDLDPTYKDAYGRPLLRLTFDWDDNEIRASQFLVGKALEMSKLQRAVRSGRLNSCSRKVSSTRPFKPASLKS